MYPKKDMLPGFITLLPETSGVNLRPALGFDRLIPWGDLDTPEKRRAIADGLPLELRDDLLRDLAVAALEHVQRQDTGNCARVVEG